MILMGEFIRQIWVKSINDFQTHLFHALRLYEQRNEKIGFLHINSMRKQRRRTAVQLFSVFVNAAL